jgi:DegV family protein with EDD domain
MIVVASAGLNLPRDLISQLGIEETPHQIVVDGALHDTRSIDSIAALQKLIEGARSPPHPLGSSAPEYVSLFNELVKRTSEVLVVTGTRKFLGTYDAAVVASRLLASARKGFEARVLDTGMAELGAGLVAIYCAAAARAGHGLKSIIAAAQALADASLQLFAPQSADFLVQRGRSDLARTIQASGVVSPIFTLKDGEFRYLGGSVDPRELPAKLADLVQHRYRPRSALWVTITFGADATPAKELLTLLRRQFDIRYALLRPISPVGCLVLGSKAIGVSAHAVESMKLMVRLPDAR